MDRIKTMKVKLTLRDDIEVTDEVKEWLRCVEAKISEKCGKVESEIKRRISLGLPIIFKDGNIVAVEDIINLPDIKALSRPSEPDLIQSEVEAEKTLRFLKTGRQHD